MTLKAGRTGPAKLRRRKDDFVKPDHLTFDQWLSSLENDRADINRQIRREIHTRGFVHGKYCERLDRAIIFARAAIAKATDGGSVVTQTVLMFAASIWLVVLVALFQTENLRSAFVFKVIPALLSVGLSVFAFARVMGWPI